MINEQIRAKEVRVIDGDGSQLGVMSVKDALKIAYAKDLDLVEISPNSDPPVCRVMDYGKYRFERDKKEKEAKKKQQMIDVKEIQLSCRIDTHDFETKLKHARKFLDAGNKVKVCVKFRGREMAHTAIGQEIITKFGDACLDIGVIEKMPVLDGRQMIMFINSKQNVPQQASSKKKAAKPAENAVKEEKNESNDKAEE
ncbi:MAG: translation initiation factor IF-3 [Clostridiales bacterium]|nr:translation initiation factor IF-3 [Clostridiales bacterium]